MHHAWRASQCSSSACALLTCCLKQPTAKMYVIVRPHMNAGAHILKLNEAPCQVGRRPAQREVQLQMICRTQANISLSFATERETCCALTYGFDRHTCWGSSHRMPAVFPRRLLPQSVCPRASTCPWESSQQTLNRWSHQRAHSMPNLHSGEYTPRVIRLLRRPLPGPLMETDQECAQTPAYQPRAHAADAITSSTLTLTICLCPCRLICWGGRRVRTARVVPAAGDAADTVRSSVAERGVAAPGYAVGARQLARALRLIERPAVAQQRVVVVPCGSAPPPQPALRQAARSTGLALPAAQPRACWPSLGCGGQPSLQAQLTVPAKLRSIEYLWSLHTRLLCELCIITAF